MHVWYFLNSTISRCPWSLFSPKDKGKWQQIIYNEAPKVSKNGLSITRRFQISKSKDWFSSGISGQTSGKWYQLTVKNHCRLSFLLIAIEGVEVGFAIDSKVNNAKTVWKLARNTTKWKFRSITHFTHISTVIQSLIPSISEY